MSILKTSSSRHLFSSVIFAGENNSLHPEIIFQLTQYPHLRVFNLINQLKRQSTPLNLSGVIFFIGFGSSSFNQSLICTEILLDYLRLSLVSQSRFILVLGPHSSPSVKTAITLTQQFAQIHRIRIDVIQTDSAVSLSDTAEAILQQLIFRHRKKNLRPSPLFQHRPAALKSPSRSASLHVSSFVKKILSALLGILIGLLIAWPFLNRLTQSCWINNFQKLNFSSASTCLRFHQLINSTDPFSRLFPPYSPSDPGYRFLADITSQVASPRQSIDSKNFLSSDLVSRFGLLAASLKNNSKLPQDYPLLASRINLLSSLAQKIPSLFSEITPASSSDRNRHLLITFHDPSSVSPLGGRISGVAVVPFSDAGFAPPVFYSATYLDSIFPGRLQAGSDYRQLTGRQYLDLSDLSFFPSPQSGLRAAADYVENSLSVPIDYVISLTPSSYSEIFCRDIKLPFDYCALSSQLFSSQFSLPENIFSPSAFSQLSPAVRNSLFWRMLTLLEEHQAFLVAVNPNSLQVIRSGWTGEPALIPDCDSWLPCLAQKIVPSFSLVSPVSIPENLRYSLSLSNHLSATSVISDLAIDFHPQPVSPVKMVFWLSIPGSVHVSDFRLDDKLHLPQIQHPGSGQELTLYGYLLDLDLSHPPRINVQLSLNNQLAAGRFRYQLAIQPPPGITAALDLRFTYPPSWAVFLDHTPSVASAGTLRYNEPPVPNVINLDLIPK